MFTSYEKALGTEELAEFVRGLVTNSVKVYGESG